MSGTAAAHGAILAALQGDGPLAALVNQIADGEPVKASPPWLLVDAPQATIWGARGVEGLTVRQPIQLALRGEEVSAVTAILDQIDAVLQAIGDDLGDWRITSLRPERIRIGRAQGEWRASVDYGLRLVRLV